MAERARALPPRPDPPLADLGLVGDGHTAALVGSDGSVAWWCPARFDAPSVFASVLDARRGGHFTIGVPAAHRREFAYVDDTNVLRSLLVTAGGRLEVTTFMPYEEARHPDADERRILRRVACLEGEVEVAVELAPRFDYAREGARVRAVDGGVLAAPESGGAPLRLSSTLALEVEPGRAVQRARLRAGDVHAFVLAHAHEPRAVADPRGVVEDALARERSFWPEWLSRCTYAGAYERQVHRSLLALKLMQYVPTGAFVAAPTLGLPEVPGGAQNWDYRYAWLRDGSFIVMAFETMGFDDEAVRFRRWLAEVVKRDAPDDIQMLYRVDGERDLPEVGLDHLRGWRGSAPLLLGNKAVEQHQLDTYGEVMMCYHRAPRVLAEQGDLLWPALRALVDRVCETWREPDSGIWELRSAHRQYVYSKTMGWLAIQHGLRIAREHGADAPLDAWERTAREVRRAVESEGWSEERRAYKQAFDHDAPDGSLLLLPLFGFAGARDARVVQTVERLERELASHDLLHRHLEPTREGNEGAFLAVNFWLAHVLAHMGRAQDARRLFEAALDVAGPLGLLPEEADAVSREGLGNHPQALTHLALVLAAYAIEHPDAGGEALREERVTRAGRGSH